MELFKAVAGLSFVAGLAPTEDYVLERKLRNCKSMGKYNTHVSQNCLNIYKCSNSHGFERDNAQCKPTLWKAFHNFVLCFLLRSSAEKQWSWVKSCCRPLKRPPASPGPCLTWRGRSHAASSKVLRFPTPPKTHQTAAVWCFICDYTPAAASEAWPHQTFWGLWQGYRPQ